MQFAQTRLLGAQEILFYTLNQHSPKHFLLAADIEGSTTAEAWQAALAAVQQRHPLLSMSIVAVGKTELVFKQLADQPIPLEVISSSSLSDWQAELAKELATSVDSWEGPLVRVKVLLLATGCEVLFAVHHAIADGMSVVYLLHDLLQALAGNELEPLALAPTADALLGLESTGLATKIIEQLQVTATPNPSTSGALSPQVDYAVLPRVLTQLLVQRAKAEHTTVHGALQAALVQALAALAPAMTSVNIMSPISSRALLQVGADCGLFFATKTVAFNPGESANFWALARLAKAELTDTQSFGSAQAFVGRLRGLMQQSDNFLGAVMNGSTFDVMLSNLGQYPFPTTYGAHKLRGIAGPFMTAGFAQQQTIGAITVDGKLCLSNTSNQLVTGLLTQMQTILSVACGGQLTDYQLSVSMNYE